MRKCEVEIRSKNDEENEGREERQVRRLATIFLLGLSSLSTSKQIDARIRASALRISLEDTRKIFKEKTKDGITSPGYDLEGRSLLVCGKKRFVEEGGCGREVWREKEVM